MAGCRPMWRFLIADAQMVLGSRLGCLKWPTKSRRLNMWDAIEAGFWFAKDYIPGAINIDWRQTGAGRHEIPKDKLVVV